MTKQEYFTALAYRHAFRRRPKRISTAPTRQAAKAMRTQVKRERRLSVEFVDNYHEAVWRSVPIH